jgi:dCMP deaminase
MKAKHLSARIDQCKLIAKCSPCPRRKVGALIIDPLTNVIISEGYNGTPRDSKKALCGGDTCRRICEQIESGTQNDIGCHHAESNAILNACRVGQSTLNRWLIVNCDPCLMCAKSIHHAGIVKVFCPNHGGAGIDYLIENSVEIETLVL